MVEGRALHGGSSQCPRLEVLEVTGGCELWAAGHIAGRGASLQEAANDLVDRLLTLAISIRTSGLSATSESGAIDVAWVDFIWRVGEHARRGGDIRDLLFAGDGS